MKRQWMSSCVRKRISRLDREAGPNSATAIRAFQFVFVAQIRACWRVVLWLYYPFVVYYMYIYTHFGIYGGWGAKWLSAESLVFTERLIVQLDWFCLNHDCFFFFFTSLRALFSLAFVLQTYTGWLFMSMSVISDLNLFNRFCIWPSVTKRQYPWAWHTPNIHSWPFTLFLKHFYMFWVSHYNWRL